MGGRVSRLCDWKILLYRFKRSVASRADFSVKQRDVGLEGGELPLEKSAFILVVLKRAVVDVA